MAGKKTPVFDWDKGDFKTTSQGRVMTATDADALKQIVLKIHSTPRGVFLVYARPDNLDLNHKYGTDAIAILLRTGITEDVRESELKRAIRDALVFDPWITDVTDITVYKGEENGEPVTYADYTLATIFDTTQTVKGAVISE